MRYGKARILKPDHGFSLIFRLFWLSLFLTSNSHLQAYSTSLGNPELAAIARIFFLF